jgi:hypothetical protein
MFGYVKKKDFEAFQQELRQVLTEIANNSNKTSKSMSDYDEITETVLSTQDPIKLQRLQQALRKQRQIINELNQSQRMTGHSGLRKPNNQPEMEDLAPEQQIADLEQKTDYIKGIWAGLPAVLKTGINAYAKKYTGGKSIDEVLSSSENIQNLITQGAGVAGAAIGAVNKPKPKSDGLLDIERPYPVGTNPNA